MMAQFVRSCLLIAVSFFGLQIQAGPRVIGNGGEPLEIMFKEISQNIYRWIESGNADRLNLPLHITLDHYKTSMLSALKEYSVDFTSDAIVLNGMEKTCINFRMDNINQIRCNASRFQRIGEADLDDLYRLIHHEFAGLAGLETSIGLDSSYEISRQISAFLSYEIVKRLPVQSVASQDFSCFAELSVRGKKMRTQLEDIADLEPYMLKGVLANFYIYTSPLEGGTGFEVLVSESSVATDRTIYKGAVSFHEKNGSLKSGGTVFTQMVRMDSIDLKFRFMLIFISVQCELGP